MDGWKRNDMPRGIEPYPVLHVWDPAAFVTVVPAPMPADPNPFPLIRLWSSPGRRPR